MRDIKNILVTGANGQLGKSIQEIAKDYPDCKFDFKTSKEFDITNAYKVASTFLANTYDYCINCAAYTNVEQAEKTPEIAFKVNAEAVKNLAISCKKNNVILIHISTDYVFDGNKKEPYTVQDSTNPINEYGKSKVLGEKYIQELLKDYVIIRTSWLYSKVYGNNFYKFVLEKAKKREPLQITDAQIGCPTNAKNLATHILEKIVEGKEKFGIQHFTDNIPMTWYDFALKILLNHNLEDKVELTKAKNYRTFAKRPINSILKKTLT